jgi:hypothetical protein
MADAPQRLSRADLEQVEIDTPGGVIRPWRFASDGAEVHFDGVDLVI